MVSTPRIEKFSSFDISSNQFCIRIVSTATRATPVATPAPTQLRHSTQHSINQKLKAQQAVAAVLNTSTTNRKQEKQKNTMEPEHLIDIGQILAAVLRVLQMIIY